MLFEGGALAVDHGLSPGEMISVMMQHYQVDDQAVREALRVLRAGYKDDTTRSHAVMDLVNQWPYRFPPGNPPPTTTTAPVQP